MNGWIIAIVLFFVLLIILAILYWAFANNGDGKKNSVGAERLVYIVTYQHQRLAFCAVDGSDNVVVAGTSTAGSIQFNVVHSGAHYQFVDPTGRFLTVNSTHYGAYLAPSGVGGTNLFTLEAAEGNMFRLIPTGFGYLRLLPNSSACDKVIIGSTDGSQSQNTLFGFEQV